MEEIPKDVAVEISDSQPDSESAVKDKDSTDCR